MTYQEALILGGMRQEEYTPFVEQITQFVTVGGGIFAASALASMTMSAKALGKFELLICSDGDFELTDWNIDNPRSINGKLNNIDDVIKAIDLLTPHLDEMRANKVVAA
jgi:hypothetical protein